MKGEEEGIEKNILEFRETKKKASSSAGVMIISTTRQRRHRVARTVERISEGSLCSNGKNKCPSRSHDRSGRD